MTTGSEEQADNDARRPWTTPAVILADSSVTAGPIDGSPEVPSDSQGTS